MITVSDLVELEHAIEIMTKCDTSGWLVFHAPNYNNKRTATIHDSHINRIVLQHLVLICARLKKERDAGLS